MRGRRFYHSTVSYISCPPALSLPDEFLYALAFQDFADVYVAVRVQCQTMRRNEHAGVVAALAAPLGQYLALAVYDGHAVLKLWHIDLTVRADGNRRWLSEACPQREEFAVLGE